MSFYSSKPNFHFHVAKSVGNPLTYKVLTLTLSLVAISLFRSSPHTFLLTTYFIVYITAREP